MVIIIQSRLRTKLVLSGQTPRLRIVILHMVYISALCSPPHNDRVDSIRSRLRTNPSHAEPGYRYPVSHKPADQDPH